MKMDDKKELNMNELEQVAGGLEILPIQYEGKTFRSKYELKVYLLKQRLKAGSSMYGIPQTTIANYWVDKIWTENGGL